MTVSPGHRTEPTGLPTFSEQMAEQIGGWRGLVESSIPVLVFVIANVVTKSVFDLTGRSGLRWSIGVSVGVALLIAAVRLAQRRPVRHAVNGLVGIFIGAALAWRTGQAKDFYLPGIYYGYGYAVVLLVSAAIRKPVVGFIWSVLANGGRNDWRYSPRLMRTFRWLTTLWGVVWVLKVAAQHAFYLADMETALGVSRLVLGYPPYVLLLVFTVWTIRRLTNTPPGAPGQVAAADASTAH